MRKRIGPRYVPRKLSSLDWAIQHRGNHLLRDDVSAIEVSAAIQGSKVQMAARTPEP
jgi:hypothetical protein